MIRPLLGLFLFALLAASACGGGVVTQNQSEGEVCADQAGSYACNISGDTILICDSSSLWRRQDACDQGSACTASGEEGSEQLCCTVDGEEACYPEPFELMLLPAPEPDATIG